MSKVNALITGWVGYGDGGSMLLEAGQEFDETDPIVQERPDVFTEPEKPAKGRGKSADG